MQDPKDRRPGVHAGGSSESLRVEKRDVAVVQSSERDQNFVVYGTLLEFELICILIIPEYQLATFLVDI